MPDPTDAPRPLCFAGVYIGSNHYITMGAGSNVYQQLVENKNCHAHQQFTHTPFCGKADLYKTRLFTTAQAVTDET